MSKPNVTTRFFALRSSLLPWSSFAQWGGSLSAAAADDASRDAAVAADRIRLREALREAIEDPVVAEALWVASPSLHQRLGTWFKNPDSKKGRGVEAAVVRYFARMSGRSTPFGLFAGGSVGTVGEVTRLTLPPRSSNARHTRLDMDYLSSLVDSLGRDRALREELTYTVNTSLYRAGHRLRYAEERMTGRNRTYHLVAVEEDEYLRRVIDRARAGASLGKLIETLVEPEITAEDAREYLHELIESQILVPNLEPRVTGDEAITGLVDALQVTDAGRATATALQRARSLLGKLDADGVGAIPDRYLEVAAALEEIPVEADLPRLFQVDMVKPTKDLALARPAVEHLVEAAEALYRIFAAREDRTFAEFRRNFEDRYADRQVPLVEALDEEIGIGFLRSSATSADASPLLDGLAFPGNADGSTTLRDADRWLTYRLTECLQAGETELVITKKDLERFPEPELPWPPSHHLMATLVASSAAAVDAGDYRWVFISAGGPSGARLLGRFCHADPELLERVREHLAEEAEVYPETTLAEIVHRPQGRIGNILARPVLREAEIVFLGGSGSPRQILVEDLLVGIEGRQVVLRHRETQERILPRLSTAHNFSLRSLGVYRFLCMLQTQDVAGGVQFSWGSLSSAAFLPRVRFGNVIVQSAQWILNREELQELKGKSGAALMTQIQELRAHRGLPRWIGLVDGDNVLPVDLENILSLESFEDVVGRRGSCTVEELHPAGDDLVVSGPEGGYVHEVVIPVLRSGPTRSLPAPATIAKRRKFPPGSEWLYAKIYTGPSSAERVMSSALAPLVQEAMSEGLADEWFFIRFSDPDVHLRVRFRGDPSRLLSELYPRLHRHLDPFLADGVVWKLQLDAYDREMSRYGGDAGIEVCESVFRVDSDAALALTQLTDGDDGIDRRWRLTLRGMDELLDAMGCDLAEKHQIMEQCALGFGREFNVQGPFKQQIRDRYRQERKDLEALLAAPVEGEELEVLAVRAQRLKPLLQELRSRQADLATPYANIGQSLLHMQANRMLRSAHRAQEMVIYQFLERIYASQIARQKKRR